MIPLKDNVPTSRFPLVTVLLIVANLVVFAWQLSFSDSEESEEIRQGGITGLSERDQASIEYGAIPYRILHPGEGCAVGVPAGQAEADILCEGTPEYEGAELGDTSFVPLDEAPWWATVFLSMFMHGGLLHIAFNMLFLWIFGNNVEDSMGRARYLGFYLLAGIVAVYSQALIDPDSTVPTIGASGAVAGVLGGYLLLLPHARVLTLIFIIFFVTLVEIPAYVMLGIWFVLQFLPAVGQVATPVQGGVAYLAHVGGFVFGLAAIRLFARRRPEFGGGGPQYPVY
ncbi:MAG TPA: rhomboid family intramembrane serine protease [Solirubrobacterales bacterium]|nr:rhomboid family intramembrane serine protease [Solirubrobacterales bacterium]